jgi:hypothetical protein
LSLVVTGCANGDPSISGALVPQPSLTPEQAHVIDDAALTVDETDTTFCLTAGSDALDLNISDMCLRVPFADVELMHISAVPRGLFDERYSAVSLWIMPLAEAVVDVEAAPGKVDPIVRGNSGALMILSEAVSNVTPMTLVVVYRDTTLRCRLTYGSNNCLSA